MAKKTDCWLICYFLVKIIARKWRDSIHYHGVMLRDFQLACYTVYFELLNSYKLNLTDNEETKVAVQFISNLHSVTIPYFSSLPPHSTVCLSCMY